MKIYKICTFLLANTHVATLLQDLQDLQTARAGPFEPTARNRRRPVLCDPWQHSGLRTRNAQRTCAFVRQATEEEPGLFNSKTFQATNQPTHLSIHLVFLQQTFLKSCGNVFFFATKCPIFGEPTNPRYPHLGQINIYGNSSKAADCLGEAPTEDRKSLAAGPFRIASKALSQKRAPSHEIPKRQMRNAQQQRDQTITKEFNSSHDWMPSD